MRARHNQQEIKKGVIRWMGPGPIQRMTPEPFFSFFAEHVFVSITAEHFVFVVKRAALDSSVLHPVIEIIVVVMLHCAKQHRHAEVAENKKTANDCRPFHRR